jgi:hypothetical protein
VRNRTAPALWALAALAAALFSSRDGRAAGPFVDAPLVLPPLAFSGDVGVGFGTYQTYALDPSNPQRTIAVGGTQVGWGSSLESAIGLPFVGEIGVRIGYRFGQDTTALGTATTSPAGALAQADQYARLFDPIASEPGLSAFTNPEIRLRGGIFDLKTVQLGLETRIIVPTADGAVLALTPGLPLRVHVPGFLRVDTGLWLPTSFGSNPQGGLQPTYTLEIPAQGFFQFGDWFAGLTAGLSYNIDSTPGASNSVDVPLGVAGGYTLLGGRLDVKVQVRTLRVNDPNWASQHLGGGIGVGARLP